MSDEEHTGYRLVITGPAARTLARRLPEKVATAVREFVTSTLLENPHRLGKRLLLPHHAGTWSARRGAYRVLYEIDEGKRAVIATAIEHRADDYRSRRTPGRTTLASSPPEAQRASWASMKARARG